MRRSGNLRDSISCSSPWAAWVLLATLLPLTLACDRRNLWSTTPTPLRIGLFAADANATPHPESRYQPLVTYLESRLARPVSLTVSADPGALLAEFDDGRYDVMFHRAIMFPIAYEHSGALPLVTRQEERQATTIFLTLAADPRRALTDFRGARLDFSVRFGSSYVMGRHYLEDQGIDVERFFGDVHYASVADEAITRLRQHQTDLCVVNSQAMLRMMASGTLRSSDVKIVAETPPHAGEVWFASRRLPQDVRTGVRDAFLALSPEVPQQASVLKALSATAYLPATIEDYAELTTLMRQMNLLDADVSELRQTDLR